MSLKPLWLDRIIVNNPESRHPAQVLEFVQYLDTLFDHTVEVAWLTLFILVLLSYVYRDEILITQYDELVEDHRFALLNVVAEAGQVDCSYIAELEIYSTGLNLNIVIYEFLYFWALSEWTATKSWSLVVCNVAGILVINTYLPIPPIQV